MPALCMGFEVHQPYRLNRQFAPDPKIRKKDLFDLYFDGINKDILLRVAEKCYIPATTLVLEKLDEGFSCAFSFSGTLIEQLEKWCPDALSLFEQAAMHRNSETLAQTYYHSIASCFPDKTEFCDQVRMHTDLMRDLFHTEPAVFENTEFTFNNEIASCIRGMGFSGIYTEGVERILGWRSPNYLYSCRDIPVLLRNTPLSDDIAFRFNNRSWAMYPLTADIYARWIAGSDGEVVNIFLDYETFGEHFWQETGIFDFLRQLPYELENNGVKTLHPSQVLGRQLPVGEIDVAETISWADIEKDTSAWMGNDRQRAAYNAIQAARPYAKDLPLWRYMLTSDHFYYMASKYGSCGEVHTYFSHHNGEEAFRTYMRVLADYEGRNIRVMKNRRAAKTLRTVSPEAAFHFAGPSGFIGYTAYNLDQFCELLHVVPKDSIQYHKERGDFVRWVTDVLNDEKLAGNINDCNDRQEFTGAVCQRREELWSRLR